MKAKKQNKVLSIILAVVILLGFVVLSQIPISTVLLVNELAKLGVIWGYIGAIVWALLLYVIIKFTWKYYRKISGDEDRSIKKGDVGRALVYFLIGRVLAVVFTLVMQGVYGEGTSANDEAIQGMFTKGTPVIVLLLFSLSISIAAPILEELIFRGLTTHLLFKKTPTWVPMIVTSLAFSGVHQSSNIISFLMYFSLGMLMYHAYQRRGRIVDSMLFHFFNNLIAGIALFLTSVM